MIIRIEDLKNISSVLLASLSSSSLTVNSNILEFVSQGTNLLLKFSTGESYIEIKLPQDEKCDLNATIDAELFLKLIEKITSEAINLEVQDNHLIVKGSGVYKFPIIGDDIHVQPLELPVITATTPLTAEVLHSIYKYNTKEVGKGTAVKPVQKMYYIDQDGCVTFTQGACINNFHLEAPLQILLSERVVKLFKLFDPATSLTLNVGPFQVTDELIQTRVCFASDSITIVAALVDNDTLVNSMPVQAIRQIAQDEYPFSISVAKTLLTEAINRLLLFPKGVTSGIFGRFSFTSTSLRIEDVVSTNYEEVPIVSQNMGNKSYTATFDLVEWKNKLSSCTSPYTTVKVGTTKAGLIFEKNVIYVLPECSDV